MTKCKPSYKNLNLIQSFSEQRYVTVQLLEQICMNDEWLRQQVEKLKYLSSPAIRKWFRFSENSLDLSKSWGCKVSNEGDVILDNCMGVGSTAIACMNTGRKFIGMEIDDIYFDKANTRVKNSKNH